VATEPEEFPEEMRNQATSLLIEGINPRVDAIEGILTSFLAGCRLPLRSDEIVDEYRQVCATIGRPVRARTTDGSKVEGRAVDLDAHGGLVVETTSGLRVVSFGEVGHVDSGVSRAGGGT
jgi:BirA family biotin operon repressor/biotin-[acetyl-CoA-carboxylase] ligase